MLARKVLNEKINMGSSIVSVKNLSHRYSVQWAIKDISFDGFVGVQWSRQINYDEYYLWGFESDGRGSFY